MINVTTNLVLKSKQLGCNNYCYDKVPHNSCYDKVCYNSSYNEAGCNSCNYETGHNSYYDKTGRNSWYDEFGCIGILLRILHSDLSYYGSVPHDNWVDLGGGGGGDLDYEERPSRNLKKVR